MIGAVRFSLRGFALVVAIMQDGRSVVIEATQAMYRMFDYVFEAEVIYVGY